MSQRLSTCIWVEVLVLVSGCTARLGLEGRAGSTCAEPANCAAGWTCIDNTCKRLCDATDDCGLGFVCDGGACDQRQTPAGDAPVITVINGTGSMDGAVGHTERHLKDRIVILGEHLTGAFASLTGTHPASGPYALAACSSGADSQLELALPDTIVPGDYLLTLSNQAGSCNASLSLLQGEPGSLDASGAEIVATVNATLASDPSLTLNGALNGKVTTLFAAASATQASARSILVQGQEQVDSAEAGLYLVTFDLATHQVHDQQVVGSFRSKGIFRPGVPAEIVGLNDVLVALSTEHVAILASVGDVTALMQDGALNTALKRFGASSLVDTLAADEAYILIGMKDIGTANGLEQAAGAERSGLATASSAAMNQSLLGLRRIPASSAPGTASDLACTGCVQSSEVESLDFAKLTAVPSYAGSASARGPATTALAFTANGANCTVGNAPLGVDVSGAAEACFDVATQAELDAQALGGHAGVSISSPTSGQVLAYNGSVWANQAAGTADNLGNHTATANIRLNGHYLSGDGGNEGVTVDAAGNVGIGTDTPAYALDVQGISQTGSEPFSGPLQQAMATA